MSALQEASIPATDDAVVRRLAVAGVVVAATSIVVTFLAGMIEGTVLPYDRLNPDYEGSLFNWASSGSELIAAFACAAHALVSPRSSRAFAVLTGLLLFIALDDAFVVHETIGAAAQRHSDFAARLGAPVWTALYAPMLVLVAVLLWHVVRATRWEAERLLLAGLGCFTVAISLELMGVTPVGEPLSFVVSEEALELGGWELVASALTIVVATSLMLQGYARAERSRSHDSPIASTHDGRDSTREAV